jgi:rhodanese-related sulfurtransferase
VLTPVRIWLLVLLLPALAGATDLLSPGLSPAELQERLASPDAPLVVDVRKPIEYAAAHIPGAKNIPLDEIESRLGEFRSNTGVLVYCINGARTRQAEPLLFNHEIENVYHLEGAFQAWIREQLPIEKGGVKKTGW